MNRVRGWDIGYEARMGLLFSQFGKIGDSAALKWNATRRCWRGDCRIFLSEMSCGEVVAGCLLFPGRAFEFPFLRFFFACLHPFFCPHLLHFGHVATGWRQRTVQWYNTPPKKACGDCWVAHVVLLWNTKLKYWYWYPPFRRFSCIILSVKSEKRPPHSINPNNEQDYISQSAVPYSRRAPHSCK